MNREKSILLLARNDPLEAMRVAAGLTIFGHSIRLIFTVPVPETAESAEQAELLELSDIAPESTLPGLGVPVLEAAALGQALVDADQVINI
jgi:hypothetical protein